MRVEQIHAGHVLGTGALLAPVLGVFAPHLIAFLAILVVLALLAGHVFRRVPFPPIDWGFMAIVGILLIWSGLSLIWTVDFAKAAEKWAAVFIFAPLAISAFAIVRSLPESNGRVVKKCAAAGTLLGIFLVVLELATDGFLSRFTFPGQPFTIEFFNRSPSVLLIFIWPAIAFLWPRSRLAALFLAVLGILIGLVLPSEAALMGFAVGITLFAVSWFAAGILRWVLAATVALGIMLSPIISLTIAAPDTIREAFPNVHPSLLHRLQIWDFTSRHIAQKPILGWGFNAARAIPGGDVRYLVKDRAGHTIGEGDRLPLHPHNGALQIWLELGIPGALALSGLLALAVFRVSAIHDRSKRAFAMGMLFTVIPIGLFSFGIWQGWWLGLLVLAALLMTVTTAEH